MAHENELLALVEQVREFKKAKDWDGAANALRKQKRLQGDDWCNIDLAKILQQAGHFDEAILEIDWLFAHSRQQQETPGWVHLPKSMKEARHLEHCAKIHDTAALICKREKHTDLARFHYEQATRLRGQHEAIQVRADQDYQEAYIARGEPFKAIMESESYQLERLATKLKKAGDWNGAIDALRRVKALACDSYADTRLAKYLQDAGRFDEAMVEIQWLLDHSQSWAQAMFGHQPVSVMACQTASWRTRVHAAAVLICKRAKRTDLQSEHEQLQDHYVGITKRLKTVSDADMNAKRAAWELASQQGPDAMAAYHQKYGRSQS